MKVIQVSAATNNQLNWLVLVARHGTSSVYIDDEMWVVLNGIADMPLHAYTPTTDWSQMGPIIEREKLDVLYMGDGVNEHYWRAEIIGGYTFAEGLTPLIAAARCYVVSKLGETVEIPEELD